MEKPKPECKVCGEPTTRCCNGVVCCDACNSFFRKKHVVTCKFNSRCPIVRKCKACRMQKCRDVGLDKEQSKKILSEKLVELNEERFETLAKFKPMEGFNYTIKQLTRSEIFRLFAPGLPSNHMEWAIMSQLTAIEFLKNLPIYDKLPSEEDKELFIRSNRFRFSIFSMAYGCNVNNCKELKYTTDIEIFSREILTDPYISSHLLNTIRTTLIKKFSDLEVTFDEFAFLCGVFIFESVDNVSIETRYALQRAQNACTDVLYAHCRKKYGNDLAHWRFAKLIDMSFVLKKTHEEMDYVYYIHAIGRMSRNPLKVEEIVAERESLLNFE